MDILLNAPIRLRFIEALCAYLLQSRGISASQITLPSKVLFKVRYLTVINHA